MPRVVSSEDQRSLIEMYRVAFREELGSLAKAGKARLCRSERGYYCCSRRADGEPFLVVARHSVRLFLARDSRGWCHFAVC